MKALPAVWKPTDVAHAMRVHRALVEQVEKRYSEATGGPWGFGNVGEGRRMVLGDGGKGHYVCDVQIHQIPRHMGRIDEEEREANAKFIVLSRSLVPALVRGSRMLLVAYELSNTAGKFIAGAMLRQLAEIYAPQMIEAGLEVPK